MLVLSVHAGRVGAEASLHVYCILPRQAHRKLTAQGTAHKRRPLAVHVSVSNEWPRVDAFTAAQGRVCLTAYLTRRTAQPDLPTVRPARVRCATLACTPCRAMPFPSLYAIAKATRSHRLR